jgi:hypothetical protein
MGGFGSTARIVEGEEYEALGLKSGPDFFHWLDAQPRAVITRFFSS